MPDKFAWVQLKSGEWAQRDPVDSRADAERRHYGDHGIATSGPSTRRAVVWSGCIQHLPYV